MARGWGMVAVALGVVACSPALDWREFSPEGSGIVATFPCRIDRHARVVAFGPTSAPMELMVCSAGGASYSIGFIDVADPAQVTAVLAEWRRVTVANLQAEVLGVSAPEVRGMTPNAEAARLRLSGRRPDGTAVVADTSFFVHGLRLYQATVLGPGASADAASPFFRGLRFPT